MERLLPPVPDPGPIFDIFRGNFAMELLTAAVGHFGLFDKLADDYDGEAMAPIDEIDRRNREYTCNSCNMHLPFELVAQLSNRSDHVRRCPSCTRILYVREDMKMTTGKK